MKYELIDRAKYYIIIDTERDVIVLLSTNRVLCQKMLELYNGNRSNKNGS
jgi:hypothetical protein